VRVDGGEKMNRTDYILSQVVTFVYWLLGIVSVVALIIIAVYAYRDSCYSLTIITRTFKIGGGCP